MGERVRPRTVNAVGFIKHRLAQVEHDGFWPSNDTVCRSHVHDPYLRAVLQAITAEDACAVCASGVGTDRVAVADISEIVAAVLHTYRRRAIDELYHDAEDPTGYGLGESLINDTEDTIVEFFNGAVDDDLLAVVAANFDEEQWFDPSDLWLENHDLLIYSWAQFREHVNQTRPTLTQLLNGPANNGHQHAFGHHPSRLLPELASFLGDIGAEIEESSSTAWYRAVVVPPGTERTPARLGTAPARFAKANRLSRAGKPLFYGAEDTDTARREIGTPPPGHVAATGRWLPSRPMKLLDVFSKRNLPSLYDVDHAKERWQLIFLEHFSGDIARPVGDPDQAYNATQLLAEFLLDALPDLDGIVYRSSITNRRCCALRVINENCLASLDPDLHALHLILVA